MLKIREMLLMLIMFIPGKLWEVSSPCFREEPLPYFPRINMINIPRVLSIFQKPGINMPKFINMSPFLSIFGTPQPII